MIQGAKDRRALAGIVKRLRSGDMNERVAAAIALWDRFDDRPPGEEDLRFLVAEAAAGGFPDLGMRTGAGEIMAFVARFATPTLAPWIDGHYEHMDPDAREYSVQALAACDSREWLQRSLERFEGDADVLARPSLTFSALEWDPDEGDLLFPRLLRATSQRPSHMLACNLLLDFLNRGAVGAEAVAASMEYVRPAAERLLEEARRQHAKCDPSWPYDEASWLTRGDLALVADLLGHDRDPASVPILHATLDHPDPWPALFAARSLMQRRGKVSVDVIERLAASAETRGIAFGFLRALGREALFPERWRTKEAFAESDLVHWLTFPTELGRPPTEIELVLRSAIGTPQGDAEMFLFRFRTHEPHWAAAKGWLAGVAGPFLKDARPGDEKPGGTFSSFVPFDELSPEEHIGALVETIEQIPRPTED